MAGASKTKFSWPIFEIFPPWNAAISILDYL
jgi:hypothetical protein